MVVSYFVFDAQIRQTSFSRKIRFYCRRFCFLTVHTVLPAFCQPLHTFCFISLQPSSDCTCSYSCLSAGCFLTDFPFCNLLNNCYSLFCCSFFPFGHNFTPSMFDSAFIISLSPIEGAYQFPLPAQYFKKSHRVRASDGAKKIQLFFRRHVRRKNSIGRA